MVSITEFSFYMERVASKSLSAPLALDIHLSGDHQYSFLEKPSQTRNQPGKVKPTW